MNSYIARQPIFDKNVQIYAYELLFRNNASETAYVSGHGDRASSRVAVESFHTRGVETITGGKPAFINFTPTLLLENIATLFPRERLVIEILEDVEPTDEIVRACQNLKSKGYTFALDDFVYRADLAPLIEICKIIKFDFLSNTPDEIRDMMDCADLRGKVLLAEKIETNEMFDIASQMGFSLFQGYFFSRPVTLESKELAPLKANYISLIREINSDTEMNFNKLGEIVRNDIALSYRLLKLVNSAYYGLRTEVTDITRALTVLGTKEIRKWIFLIAIMGLNTDKPDELIRTSLVRGRFMEMLVKSCGLGYSSENTFLTGLFSILDVLLERPMDKALDGLSLDREVYDALLGTPGGLYDILGLVISLEQGKWETADRISQSLGADSDLVTNVYLSAVKWCNDMPF